MRVIKTGSLIDFCFNTWLHNILTEESLKFLQFCEELDLLTVR